MSQTYKSAKPINQYLTRTQVKLKLKITKLEAELKATPNDAKILIIINLLLKFQTPQHKTRPNANTN